MFEPRNRRLLILPDAPDEKSEGGIVFSEKARDKKLTGELIAASKDCSQEWPIGSKVYYPSHISSIIVLNKTQYLLVEERDVFGLEIPQN